MNFVPFSKKQLDVLSWWSPSRPSAKFDAIICDGAVRSGKTLCMSVSFISWAMFAFDNHSFAICGKTIKSVKRNVAVPLLNALRDIGFDVNEKIASNLFEVSLNDRKNTFYLFGGRDESSAALIQGMTLSGVLFDEVALMPRSFVEQAIARCSVENSKLWFNCNPEYPQHWFHREWIKKTKEKNAYYLHFTMNDNPSLSKKIRERYKTLYSGSFYDRFVLGKWVATEGLVYATTALSILPLSAYGGGLAILGTELMNITTIPVSKVRHVQMKNIIPVFAGLSTTEIFQLWLLTRLPQALLKLSDGMGNIQSSLQKTMSLTAYVRQAPLLNRAK